MPTQTIKPILSLIVTSILTTGCASSLLTYGDDKKPIPGVPVGSPALMKITTISEYVVDPKNPNFADYCRTPETVVSYAFLPLGEKVYVSFKPAALGDSEFKLDFGDSGNLKTVSLNSEATAGLDGLNSLLATALPFVAAPKPSPGAAASAPASSLAPAAGASGLTAQQTRSKYCILKSKSVASIESWK